MKAIKYTIAAFCLIAYGEMRAQQPAPATLPNSEVHPTQPNSTNPTGVYQTSPLPGQPNAVKDGDGSSSTAPGGLKQSNPYGTQQPATSTEATVNEPYNDYHLTQPTSSPATTAPQATDAPVSSDNDSRPFVTPDNGMIRLESNEIPYPLRERLNAETYNGWESSPMYYNPVDREYSISIGNGNEARSYRFDQEGNTINEAPVDKP